MSETINVPAPETRAMIRRAAALGATALLAGALVAVTAHNAAAKTRRPAVDTGFGALEHIAPPPLSNSPPPAQLTAPVRFFTINRVLAKIDGNTPTSDTVRLASRTETGTASDAPGQIAAPVGTEPFGLFTFRAPEGELWVKWRGVQADMAKEAGVMAQCRASADHCAASVTRFLAVIDKARLLDGRARLDAVNRAVNEAIRYTSDMEQHGVPDLWSAPLASYASGRGDCEDYAIAKYVALREAGVSADDVRIVLARDTAIREDHAVLAARLDGRWVILDNRRAELVDDGAERGLMPLFAIDDKGVKLFAAPYANRALDESEAQVAPATADIDAATAGGPTTLPVLM